MNAIDNFFVNAGSKHHLYHVHGDLIGDPHAFNKFALDLQSFQHGAYLGPATVDDDWVHAHQLHKHHIAGEALMQLWINHRIATKLDNKGLAGKALYVGQ